MSNQADQCFICGLQAANPAVKCTDCLQRFHATCTNVNGSTYLQIDGLPFLCHVCLQFEFSSENSISSGYESGSDNATPSEDEALSETSHVHGTNVFETVPPSDLRSQLDFYQVKVKRYFRTMMSAIQRRDRTICDLTHRL